MFLRFYNSKFWSILLFGGCSGEHIGDDWFSGFEGFRSVQEAKDGTLRALWALGRGRVWWKGWINKSLGVFMISCLFIVYILVCFSYFEQKIILFDVPENLNDFALFFLSSWSCCSCQWAPPLPFLVNLAADQLLNSLPPLWSSYL